MKNLNALLIICGRLIAELDARIAEVSPHTDRRHLCELRQRIIDYAVQLIWYGESGV